MSSIELMTMINIKVKTFHTLKYKSVKDTQCINIDFIDAINQLVLQTIDKIISERAC